MKIILINKDLFKFHPIYPKLISIWNRADKTKTQINYDKDDKEYYLITCPNKKYTSYPILTKVSAFVFNIPATSATVEYEISLTSNIITQKRSKLSSDTVNDIVFNHSYNTRNN